MEALLGGWQIGADMAGLGWAWLGWADEVQDICKKVGLQDVTKKYICRKEIFENIQCYDMKIVKEKMATLEKCQYIRNRDFRVIQPYMLEKSLQQSRIEFIWDTMMIDTRTTMKSKYEKDKYSCPHCDEGREQGVLETPSHLLVSCSAYADLRAGINPELVLQDRAQFLNRAIGRRKELESRIQSMKARSQTEV